MYPITTCDIYTIALYTVLNQSDKMPQSPPFYQRNYEFSMFLQTLTCRSFINEHAPRKANSLSIKYFQENTHKRFWIVRGQAVAPRLAKYAISGYYHI